MVQTESHSKKGNLLRRILFCIIRICKLSENKTEDDSDDYLKLMDKLRETNLAPYQMPICAGCAKPHINHLPCEHIVCETCFIGKEQEDDINLKCPHCQAEYFISWQNQLDLKHIYSAVNTEAQSMQKAGHRFKEKKEGEPNKTKTFCEICHDESRCHPGGNHCSQSPRLSPAPSGKQRKRYPFNPFSNANQYHVLNAVPDPLECQESGNHGNKSLPKPPRQEKRESDQSTSPIENEGLLGQRKPE